MHTNFTPGEHANFLAGKVTSYATAFLDGRNDAGQLARNVRSVMCELIAAPDDAQAKAILDPTRMLAVAMLGASAAEGEARQQRWMYVMAAMIELVRHECRAIKPGAVQEGTHATSV